MNKIKILITDDHLLLRQAFASFIKNDIRFELIGECGSGEEAIGLSADLLPDVILMDINLPGIDGIEATKQIIQLHPEIAIIALSTHTDPTYARKIIRCGAKGYISKYSSNKELIQAIVEVVIGKHYVCSTIKNEITDQILCEPQKTTGINLLSGRELEITEFIRKGHTSKEIAALLGLSFKTIEVHRYNILRKLNLKNSAALINFLHHTLSV
jgi:two-component system invasion response regulator UvrY